MSLFACLGFFWGMPSLTVCASSLCWSVNRESSVALRHKTINGTVMDSSGYSINARWESTRSFGGRCGYWLKNNLCLNNYWNPLSLRLYDFIWFILLYWVIHWRRLIRMVSQLTKEGDITFTHVCIHHLVN